MTWYNVFVSMGITALVMIVLFFVGASNEKRQGKEIDWASNGKTFILILTITTIGLILAHFGLGGSSRGYLD